MSQGTVFFDCERMKHANSGLFYFCAQLGKALLEEANGGEDIAFYVPSKLKGYFGEKARYKILTPLHKLFLPTFGTRVWHATYQTTAYMPAPCCKTNVILTVHDLNFLYEKGKEKHEHYIKELQRNVDRSDVVVAISKYAQRDLEAHIDIKGKPVHVIYNGCNVYKGAIEAPAVKPANPFLFTIGMVLAKKNFHVLPRLLEGNDYELVIAGRQSDYSNRIIEEAHRCGVLGRVHLVGAISDENKYWYLNNCEAFVFPSIAEGFGLPVIEAMSCGKPVFLSQYTSLPEIGSDKAYYFNKDFDGEGMRSELEAGLNDFKQRNRAEEIRQYAAKFSWKEAARLYLSLYNSLL